MNPPFFSTLPEDARWPSGEFIDLAVLPLTEGELARRIGVSLVHGIEDGLGPWAAIGGYLRSGVQFEFICYAQIPASVILRMDKNTYSATAVDEALRLVGFSRKEVRVSPLIAD